MADHPASTNLQAFHVGDEIRPHPTVSGNAGRFTRPSYQRVLLSSAVIILIGTVAFPFIPRQYVSTSAVQFRPVDNDGQLVYSTTKDQLDDNAVQTRMDIFTSSRLQSLVIN